MSEKEASGPLAGIRVADFTRVLAGPLCTMVLGDLGADVTKIERPVTGDDTRSWGPPFLGDDAAYFYSINRNKRSVVLDLADPSGAEAARVLALDSDVVVENFLPGTMERFGLGYRTLSDANPRLIYCSITAFPPGEHQDRPGYDVMIQAMSGLMSVTGPEGGEPTKVGVALADVITGQNATIGILAALQARERTGRGQRVEVSLFGSTVAALVNQASNYLIGGIVPKPMGNAHPNIAPYQVFHAADRPFVLAVGNDEMFVRMCAAIGRPELGGDERFATNEDRVTNRATLLAILEPAFANRQAADLLEALESAGVPCAPVRDLADVFASPEGRQMVKTLYDPDRAVDIPQVANPIGLSDTPVTYRLPPPRLGDPGARD
jgi:crotonobetainyl-CoA:carnitine CoA-transferase CaiB-like acyl-CoA transferase